VPSNFALLDRFAIGARVSLLWEYTRIVRNVSECCLLAVWLLIVLAIAAFAVGDFFNRFAVKDRVHYIHSDARICV